jgi:hypothetical protein
MNFEHHCRACDLFPYTPETKKILSEYLGVSPRQLNRFICGAKVSTPYLRLLEVRAHGIAANLEWQGFSICGDILVNPNGEYISVNDLKTINFTKQRFFALSEQNAYLAKKLINAIRL